MKKILCIEFWNVSPHLETSLEIAKKHLELGDEVEYHFWGQKVRIKEGVSVSKLRATLFLGATPEENGARLLRSSKFVYHGGDFFKKKKKKRRYPKFNDVHELISYEVDGLPAGMAVGSSLISKTANSRLIPDKHCKEIHKILDDFFDVYENANELIKRTNPDLIYTFNGRFSNYHAILCAAHTSGVSVKIHERGCCKDKYVVYDHMPHDSHRIQQKVVEYWQNAGEERKKLGVEFFLDRRKGQPKDWYSFTKLQKDGKLPVIPAGKRICTYFSSSDDEFVAVGDIFKSDVWQNQMEAVLHLINVFRSRKNDHLVIRLHPHLLMKSKVDRDAWTALTRFDHITVILPDSDISSYALVDLSSIVLSFGSTVGIEAVFWGKPSILLGPSFYNELGCCHVVSGVDDLERYLEDADLSVDASSALLYGYYFNTFGNEFEYYRALSLGHGLFMGVNLQYVSSWYRLVRFFYRLWKHKKMLMTKTYCSNRIFE
jgi:hypothetical protein